MEQIIIDFSEGNPGCLQFVMELIQSRGPELAFAAMGIMKAKRISGSLAYQFWNDCCERNIEECWRVLDALTSHKITGADFVNHINRPRGIPFDKEL